MIIAIDARPLVTRQVGGAEQRARNLLSAWAASARRGDAAGAHEFHLIYARPDDPAFDDSCFTDLPWNFHPLEIGRFALPLPFPTGSRVLNALSRALARIRPDVYHAFTPVIPRTRLCPVVPTLHDLSYELDPLVRRTREARILRRAALASVRIADRFIAVSSQTKSDAEAIYRIPSAKIDVIYNGIDPVFQPAADLPVRAKIHNENNINAPYILAVGADIPRRNYARMLLAMRRVWSASDAPSALLWVLAGRDDWKMSDLYGEARAAGVLDKMRFVAGPTNAELAALYRAATLTCCASSFEGFGLSVLESMACGTAVCCSDMRSLREVAEDAALYFPHDDADAMGQAIAGLLEDAEYRRQLKYRGLYRASLFTWATAADLTLQSLAAVVLHQNPTGHAFKGHPVPGAVARSVGAVGADGTQAAGDRPGESPASRTSR
ncbi:MAG TPA: glycosyltransferase family 1 protein [Phycisphaerae bacterium]|nr:glycosyltransferase family 1 protein [Phycisphaerae bacterium]